MEITDNLLKTVIDKMTYAELLSRLRFAPLGDTIFQGEIGQYYKTVMKKRREELGDDEAAEISKRIGWKR